MRAPRARGAPAERHRRARRLGDPDRLAQEAAARARAARAAAPGSPQPHQRIAGGSSGSATDPLQPVERLLERGARPRGAPCSRRSAGKSPCKRSGAARSSPRWALPLPRGHPEPPGQAHLGLAELQHAARTACPPPAAPTRSACSSSSLRTTSKSARTILPLRGRHHLGERARRRRPPRASPAATSAAGGGGRRSVPQLLGRRGDRAAATRGGHGRKPRTRRSSSAWTSCGASRSRPSRKASSTRKSQPTTSPPSSPRARTASRRCRPWRAGRRARAPACRGCTASVCSSSWPAPYSSRYSALTVSYGSLPGLRASTKPAPSCQRERRARAGSRAPRPPPRSRLAAGGRARPAAPTASASAPASAISGVMSLKSIPGLGKVGYVADQRAQSTCALISGRSCADRGSAAGA